MSDRRHRRHLGGGFHTTRFGEQVGIMTAVPDDDVADADGDRPPKDRAIVDEGMTGVFILAVPSGSREERREPS